MQTHEAGYFVKELDFLNLTSVNYNLVNLLGCCKYIHQQGFPLLFLFKKDIISIFLHVKKGKILNRK